MRKKEKTPEADNLRCQLARYIENLFEVSPPYHISLYLGGQGEYEVLEDSGKRFDVRVTVEEIIDE